MVQEQPIQKNSFRCANFISPYSLEKCAQILHDHSRRAYFQYNELPKLSYNRIRKHFIHIDIQHETVDKYTFEMVKYFGPEIRYLSILRISGYLERKGDKTRVVATINTNPTIPRVQEFITYLEKWLNTPPQAIASKVANTKGRLFKDTFDIYSPNTIATCIKKLTNESNLQHYQDTELGMMSGIATTDLFITFEEESPNRYHFLIEQNMWVIPKDIYTIPVRVVGTLEVEDNATHIYGYTYTPHGWLYAWGLLFFIIIGVLLGLRLDKDVIILVLGGAVLGFAMVQNVIQNFNKYPSLQLINKDPNKKSSSGFRFRHDFDFHSPYPVTECVNMLLDYSPHTEYRVGGNIHKEMVLSNNFRVIVTQTDDDTFNFGIETNAIMDEGGDAKLVHRIFHKGHLRRYTAFGTLKAEGYGTRVSGHSKKKLGDTLKLAMLLYGLGLSTSIFLAVAIQSVRSLGVFILIGLIALPITVIEEEDDDLLTRYIKKLLEGKGKRKNKVKDMG